MSLASYQLCREALDEYREDGLRLAVLTLDSKRKGFWPVYPDGWDEHDRRVFDRLFLCSVWELDVWVNEGVDPAATGGLTLSQRLALRGRGKVAS